MSMLALVRSSVDLTRACRELSELFVLLRRHHQPPTSAETLLGIWIEPRWVEDIPCLLTKHTALSGIWVLSQLETLGNEITARCHIPICWGH